ncbi:patatin-like phospholipase family protein [Sphaerotilus sp.]|uniref:patatin-like phospholipase family protein n=1 Tax=Sphaerotilus sp. TaxID=2093942 RepID=UPI0025CE216C|nr:patatin-like phospholipase family protein [Sphaerotilus sp.]
MRGPWSSLLFSFCVVTGGLVPPERAAAVEVGPSLGRPRIGLVLSGGGARGLAHVGVLKVLERAHIPIDAIAGTSMGAIIGGLYASGLRADELERELLALDWTTLFANRLPRETLSERRKEEDFEISPALEVGIGRVSGELMLPIGSVSSRGLELLLRRYTLPVRQVASFDALPIAFRAVATDMESGEAVVFRQGDLAQALRASMSVPGVFPPTEVDHRILGDGGLVNNLPVDVVRTMGVDVVIAVNIGTPLAGRDSLGTVLGLTSQMVNILTEQNVQRSIATLDPAHDVLIAPPLGRLTSGDFDRAADLVAAGERHTEGLLPQLAALRLGETDWQAMRRGQQRPEDPPQPIASVRFEGQDITEPERLRGVLAVQPGQPFSVERAERDSRTLAASGDYLHVDYRVEDLPAGTGLVYRVEEKPWGPHYFRLGLDVQSDFAGRGEFNVKLSHNRHWLDDSGSEWRNRVQIGSVPRWFSELYVPLGAGSGPASDGFLAVWSDIERRRLTTYQPLQPDESARALTVLGRQVRGQIRVGLDIGQPLGDLGEWRVGLVRDLLSLDAETTASTTDTTALAAGRSREWALRSGLVIDQLDHASFPRQGWRFKLGVQAGRRTLSGTADSTSSDPFHRVEADVTQVASLGRQTVETTLRLRHARQREAPGQVGHYTLGGFHNLSGYETDQLAGNDALLGRLTWMLRLNRAPVLTRGVFAGATLEAGNAWLSSRAVSLQDLRWGGSVFLGADTGLGPLYLGMTYAPRGRAGVSLMLGRP